MELLPKTRLELRLRVRIGQNAVDDLMTDEKETLPQPLVLAFAPLHRSAMGIAWGSVLGALIFLMTVTLLIKGGDRIGPNLGLLNQFFIGYTVTVTGAFVGLVYGFITGFILGWGFAFVRNIAVWAWLTAIRSRAEMDQYGDFLDHM